MAEEIELKLELTVEDATRLEAVDLLDGAPRRLQLRSVYFDTPSGLLRAAGFSLRIRQSGEQRIQTIKAAGKAAAGLFARPEWEMPVDDDCPVLDDTTPLRALLADAVHEIEPAFEIRVERLVWQVAWQEAQVEVALDRGEIIAGDRATRLCEMELELLAGNASALFDLARRIDAVTPLRLGVQSKAERGFRLLGPLATAFKAEAISLPAACTTWEAFAAIAASCIRQFRLNEPFIDRANPEALHQARVALRRLRCAFAIFRPLLNDAASARFAGELKWLAGRLGRVRDLDVLNASDALDPTDRPHLARVRDEAYARVKSELETPRARALALDLSAWLAQDATGQEASAREREARVYACGALDRYRRKVKRQGRGLSRLSDEERHTLRKNAKTLRYGADFLGSLFTEKKAKRRATRFLKALDTLQDRLGRLNDAAAEARTLRRAGLRERAESSRVPAARREQWLDDAADAYERFTNAKRFWR